VVELQEIQRFFALLAELPPLGAYAIIAAGSALENLFPPVPSDTFVVLGAVLSDRGGLSATTVLIVAWLANIAGAMFVYFVARRHGPDFFTDGWGRRVLRPHQFDRVSRFYSRYGLWAILFSRFLPVLRVVIPTFAGFAHLGWVRTLVPVALASLFWYAVVLFLGIFASQNVGRVVELLGNTNAWLFVVAGVIGLGIGIWWWRTRHEHDEDDDERSRRGTRAGEDAGTPG
jgi:membrane protein DedA with SNARE-associated domain